MSVTRVPLAQLVDLALGTPEVGAVNFNVIHTILQTVVSKTGLANMVVEHKGDIPSFGGTSEPVAPVAPVEAASPTLDSSVITKINEVLQAQADLKSEVDELSAHVNRLEGGIQSDPLVADLKTQLADLTVNYNKMSGNENNGNVSSGVNERIMKLESELSSQNDLMASLQNMISVRLGELSKQMDDIDKDMGIVNERLNIQTQSQLGPSFSPSDFSRVSKSGASTSVIDKEGGHLVADLYTKVNAMQQDMEHIVQTSSLLAEDKENLELRFDSLKEEVEVLKTVKADKMEVEDVMAGKADVAQVTRKVSHDDFNARVEEVNLNLSNAFNKLDEHEIEWQAEMTNIQAEIDSKLNTADFNPIKDYLSETVKTLVENVKALQSMRKIEDAAGAKRKIIRDLNCISCEKDVVMKQELDSDDLKPQEGVKAHQSIKPFLTYKLDQVRKHQQKLPGGRNLIHFEEMMKSADPRYKKPRPPSPIVQVDSALHICNRYCGGSHTLTTPLQRVTRTGHFFNEFGPPPPPESPRPPDPEPVKEATPPTSPINALPTLPPTPPPTPPPENLVLNPSPAGSNIVLESEQVQ